MENLARAHTSKVDEAVLPTDNNINWAYVVCSNGTLDKQDKSEANQYIETT